MKNAETANRLKWALNEANMSQQELADKSGVSKASISQYLSGIHAPSNISSEKMGNVLRINPLFLMGFDVTHEFKENNSEDEFLILYNMLSDNQKEAVINLMKTMLTK